MEDVIAKVIDDLFGHRRCSHGTMVPDPDELMLFAFVVLERFGVRDPEKDTPWIKQFVAREKALLQGEKLEKSMTFDVNVSFKAIIKSHTKIVSLFKFPKNTTLYWIGDWEEKHMCGILSRGAILDTFQDQFKSYLVLFAYIKPEQFRLKFDIDHDVGDPTCTRNLKKNCFFFKVFDELFYVELPESCVIDDDFLEDKRLKTQSQIDSIQKSLGFIDDEDKKKMLAEKLLDLNFELDLWSVNGNIQKQRETMIALLKECDLW